jgi:hypothetical protein
VLPPLLVSEPIAKPAARPTTTTAENSASNRREPGGQRTVIDSLEDSRIDIPVSLSRIQTGSDSELIAPLRE